jgi:hypothetical protein
MTWGALRARIRWWRWIRWRNPAAKARAFYHHVVRNYRYEICRACGRPVEIVWWCPDQELWDRINGGTRGILCVSCFDTACDHENEPRRWIAAPLMDAITITLDPDRNERLHRIARRRGETPEQVVGSLATILATLDEMDLSDDEMRELIDEVLDTDE